MSRHYLSPLIKYLIFLCVIYSAVIDRQGFNKNWLNDNDLLKKFPLIYPEFRKHISGGKKHFQTKVG